MTGPAASARDVALNALADRAGNVTARLGRLLAERRLSVQDAALARELALGVVRRRGTLAAVVDAFRQQDRRLPGRLRSILHLGLYQLLFLDRVPTFAAVDEAVKQARRGGRGVAGFVNALLRNVDRSVSPPQAGEPPRAADVFPVGPACWRRFDRPIFPDPDGDPPGYLAAAGSLPRSLAERWLAAFGSAAEAMAAAIHANCRPPLIFRVNALRATVQQVLAELRSAALTADAHENGLSVVIEGHADLEGLKAFTAGKLQPQDAGATAVVAAADIEPGMRVLDLCAAPGTKTTHLAERMENRGEIVAVDVNDAKLARIRDNCRRMGVEIVQLVLAGDVTSLQERSFDVVLVDAPCSNTGVLARRPEARWRFSPAGLAELVRDQKNLLALGLGFVRPGGRCIYSTCSLEREENELLAAEVAGAEKRAEILSRQWTLPAGAQDPKQWSDGGFLAVLGV